MANTLDDALFVLIDTFPGVPTNGNNPSDFTTYADSEEAAGFSIGTKRAIYNDTHKAWCTVMFAAIIGGTEGAANDLAVRDILGVDTVNAAAGTAGWACTVTNDGGECLLTGSIAIALGTTTFTSAATIKYGWVQVGGPPLVDLVSGLNGDYLTDGSVAAESGMKLKDGTGHVVFDLADAADVGVISAFSGADDAT